MRAALDFDEPELLDAFPFPHVIELDARLDPDGLAVRTTVRATGDVAVPLAYGYHPYLSLPGVPRERWEVSLPVRRRLLLDETRLPSGATEPVEPFHGEIGDRTWDDCFDDLVPGEPFAVAGGGRRIEVAFGEGYPVAQVFAPPGQGADLLRADDRPDERAGDRRRPAHGRPGRQRHSGVRGAGRDARARARPPGAR